FGLPGNPVSSMVSYELLARLGLRRMAGHSEGELRWPRAPAVVDDARGFRSAADRTSFVRVQVAFGPDGRLHVRSAGGQGSHQLHAMAIAGGLAVVPAGTDVRDGDRLDVLVLQS
ncbi:MAG: gephyrin-like molybdotransferase Glp, partial [Acidimicrobiales bacterium]